MIIAYLKLLINLITNPRYTFSTSISSIYIILRSYYKFQKNKSILIVIVYSVNIIILVILKFLQLMIFNNASIFILEIIIGLFIIAYVVQESKHYRKSHLLSFLLKPLSILVLILILTLFLYDELHEIGNTLPKKKEISLENKNIQSNSLITPSDDFQEDNKPGVLYKQTYVNRVKEFLEISKVNPAETFLKKLELEAIKAAAEAGALEEHAKRVLAWENCFAEQYRSYLDYNFSSLGRIINYVYVRIGQKNTSGMNNITRVTWLSQEQLTARVVEIAGEVLVQTATAEVVVQPEQLTETAETLRVAGSADPLPLRLDESLSTEDLLPDFIENAYLAEEMILDGQSHGPLTQTQTIKLQETQTAWDQTTHELWQKVQAEQTQPVRNENIDEEIKRWADVVEKTKEKEQKAREAAIKVREEWEKAKNEAAKAFRKAKNKANKVAKKQKSEKQTQPPASHDEHSKNYEDITQVDHVAEHAQQNLQTAQSAADKNEELLKDLDKKKDELTTKLQQEQKNLLEANQMAAKIASDKAELAETAKIASDKANSTIAGKAAVAKKKIVEIINAPRDKKYASLQVEQNQRDLTRRLLEARQIYEMEKLNQEEFLSAVEAKYRIDVEVKGIERSAQWSTPNTDHIIKKVMSIFRERNEIDKKLEAMKTKLDASEKKAYEIYQDSQANPRTLLKTDGLLQYLRSLERLNSSGPTAAPAPITAPPGEDSAAGAAAASEIYGAAAGFYNARVARTQEAAAQDLREAVEAAVSAAAQTSSQANGGGAAESKGGKKKRI